MAGKAVRTGIIGCGKVAWERHLPAIAGNPGIQVTATADIDGERSDRLARRLGAAHAFTDYRSLLDCNEVDAVAVLTPTASHAAIGLDAMDAGKHVLIEKPLALSLEECDRLIEREASARVKVAVGFNLRWHRLVAAAREFLARGTSGRAKAIRSVYTHDRTGVDAPDWHRVLSLGGGVSFNEAVHHFDLWRHLMGSDIEQVYALSVPSDQYEDETSVISARLANGVLASGVFSFRTGPQSEVEIYGELGRLCVSLYRFDGLDYFPHDLYPGSPGDRAKKAAASAAALPYAVRALRTGGEFQSTFDGLWRHFVDCVKNGAQPQTTLADGRSALSVALAACKSMRSGQPVCCSTQYRQQNA